MSIIEKIVGLVPTVRDRARTVLDFALSTKGKVTLALVLAAAVLGYAHHRGAESREPEIVRLKQELGAAKLKLAAAEQAPKPVCTTPDADAVSPNVKSWLDEQAKANEALTLKVKKYEQDLAKRRPSSGDRLSASDARRLLDIR
jgi:hypothetical protein